MPHRTARWGSGDSPCSHRKTTGTSQGVFSIRNGRAGGAASSNASGDGQDMQDIPLRRRGRPAGDGSTPLASPKELQDRRMQANRAAASRSHFRSPAPPPTSFPAIGTEYLSGLAQS